jgi:hypothetical protein
MAGRMSSMMIQKRKRRKSRSSNDLTRNIFPNRSVRCKKQEGIRDALVEYSPSIKAGSMAGLMLKKEKKTKSWS